MLTYDEALDPDSVPVNETGYAVRVAGSLAAVSVAISGREVTLTLAPPAAHGQTVTITYNVLGAGNPVRDLAGNNAAAFTNQAVTNNTPRGRPGRAA